MNPGYQILRCLHVFLAVLFFYRGVDSDIAGSSASGVSGGLSMAGATLCSALVVYWVPSSSRFSIWLVLIGSLITLGWLVTPWKGFSFLEFFEWFFAAGYYAASLSDLFLFIRVGEEEAERIALAAIQATEVGAT